MHLSGRLKASGKLSAVPYRKRCVAGQRVRIYRRGSDAWYVVKAGMTGASGRYAVHLRDRAGRYRAAVKRKPLCSPDVSRSEYEIFGATLRRYVVGRSGRISVSVFNVHDHDTDSLHPARFFYDASIVKVDIMAAVMRRAQVQHRALTARERRLMKTMIERSDNDAATKLYNEIGNAQGLATFNRLVPMPDTYPDGQWGLTRTVAPDQVRLVRRFARHNRVLTDTHRRHGLYLMRHVVSYERWGVSGGVPSAVSVALKNGWLPLGNLGWEVNSIGYVRGNGRAYVIAALTNEDPSERYGIRTIRHISAAIYSTLGAG